MEVVKLSLKEYRELFRTPYQVFNSADFNERTAAARGLEPICLGFKTKKYKLGMVGSVVEGTFRSPFSAPFGGFSYIKPDISLETIDAAVDSLKAYLKTERVAAIELTLPPLFYEVSFISKLSNSLFRHGFANIRNDLNYSLHLNSFGEDYLKVLHYNARKNLTIALSHDFNFHVCETLAEKQQAYQIIQQNRAAKGYPLRMDFEAVKNTIEVIKADFFLVRLGQEDVAAAMIFHVAPGTVQVVYWGDLPAYSSNKTMNFLSYSVIKHYEGSVVNTIDIGPSTENSIPNYGLCDFKESIGCTVYPKQSWLFNL